MKLILTIFIIGLTPCTLAKRELFYRKDYTYVEQYDAFYKLHQNQDGLSWDSAFLACEDEGSKLFYPQSNEELEEVKILATNLAHMNITDIYVGLHDEFNLGELITVDGHSTESPLDLEESSNEQKKCVYMNIETGLYRKDECFKNISGAVPFLCKKVDEESCPTIDHEYKYIKAANKCYKVHRRYKDWETAMRTCFLEGGLLAVLTTDVEINHLGDLLTNNIEYYIGFKMMYGANFYTIKGKLFENSYFNSWYRRDDNIGRDCGTLTYYNQQNIIKLEQCDMPHQFICEMEVK